jgi:hypothetical protein
MRALRTPGARHGLHENALDLVEDAAGWGTFGERILPVAGLAGALDQVTDFEVKLILKSLLSHSVAFHLGFRFV